MDITFFIILVSCILNSAISVFHISVGMEFHSWIVAGSTYYMAVVGFKTFFGGRGDLRWKVRAQKP